MRLEQPILNALGKKPGDALFKSGKFELKLSDISPEGQKKLEKLFDSTEKFEAQLLKQMLQVMERTVQRASEESGMSQLGRDLFHDSMSEHLAKSPGFKLGDILFRQLADQVLQPEMARLIQNTPKEQS